MLVQTQIGDFLIGDGAVRNVFLQRARVQKLPCVQLIQARFGTDLDGPVEIGIGFERFGGVFEIVFDAVFLHKRYVLVDRLLGFLSKERGRTQQCAQKEKVTLHKTGVLVLNQTERFSESHLRLYYAVCGR
jgi:hypothetical protein